MVNSPLWRENSPGQLQGVFDQENFCAVELAMPDVSLRQTAWERALQRFPSSGGQSWAGELASQFRLTPGQIHEAAAWVVQRRAMASDETEVTRAELYAACRKQSHHKLAELAVKIEPHYHWDDLVLPLDKTRTAQRALRPGCASPPRLW